MPCSVLFLASDLKMRQQLCDSLYGNTQIIHDRGLLACILHTMLLPVTFKHELGERRCIASGIVP